MECSLRLMSHQPAARPVEMGLRIEKLILKSMIADVYYSYQYPDLLLSVSRPTSISIQTCTPVSIQTYSGKIITDKQKHNYPPDEQQQHNSQGS